MLQGQKVETQGNKLRRLETTRRSASAPRRLKIVTDGHQTLNVWTHRRAFRNSDVDVGFEGRTPQTISLTRRC